MIFDVFLMAILIAFAIVFIPVGAIIFCIKYLILSSMLILIIYISYRIYHDKDNVMNILENTLKNTFIDELCGKIYNILQYKKDNSKSIITLILINIMLIIFYCLTTIIIYIIITLYEFKRLIYFIYKEIKYFYFDVRNN